MFSAPIGYAGLPLVPSFKSSRVDLTRSLLSSPEPVQCCSSRIALTDIPVEIVQEIARYLPQGDVIKLSFLAKYLHACLSPLLYRNIVADYQYSLLDEEFNQNNKTFIKTKYNLKRFFQRILENRFLAEEVRELHCIRLPLEMVEYELMTDHVSKVFPSLVNLRCLDWFSSNELDLKALGDLPNLELLQQLYLNVSKHKNQSEMVDADFSSLGSLAITPFIDSKNLSAIFHRLFSQTDLSKTLQELKLCRLSRKVSLLDPPSRWLVSTEDVIDLDLQTMPTIMRCLCQSGQRRLKLKKLSLEGCLIKPSDFHLLNEGIDLQKLVFLELSCVEYQKINLLDYHGAMPLQGLLPSDLKRLMAPSFLQLLAPQVMTNLRHLSLDLRQALIDSCPHFICSMRELHSLDVVVRWNDTKRESYASWPEYMVDFANAIKRHTGTLSKLSIESTDDVNQYNHSLKIPEQAFAVLFENTKYPRLTSLRLNTPSESINNAGKIFFAKTVPKLELLHVFGQDAGGPPHMGLQNIHPGLFDDWIRVQHVALQMAQLALRRNLKYVKVDKCVFELRYSKPEDPLEFEALPRENLQGWFDLHSRVSFFA